MKTPSRGIDCGQRRSIPGYHGRTYPADQMLPKDVFGDAVQESWFDGKWHHSAAKQPRSPAAARIIKHRHTKKSRARQRKLARESA